MHERADRAARCSISPTRATCRWSPPTRSYFATPDDYEAHDALLCIAEGALRRRGRPAPADARALSSSPRERDGDAVRRPAGGLRQHRRDRPALRLLPEGRASRSCRASPRADASDSGGDRQAGDGELARDGRGRASSVRLADARPAPGYIDRGLPRAAGVRARRHREDGLPRLLPDRRRTSSTGPRSTASRSGRAAARAPARWSPSRSTSPTSIRCATTCCSSASSTPSACRCRTSTSTSARTGATRSSTTSRTKYGRDQRRARSSPSATLQARAVLRDVGRVLQMPYGQVDQHLQAGARPIRPSPVTLAEGASRASRGCRADGATRTTVKRLLDIAQKLEGLNRHASMHAAGVVIGDRPLRELVPLYRDPRSRHAGHPVRQERGRGGRPGEVRLPRPEDADRHRDGGAS